MEQPLILPKLPSKYGFKGPRLKPAPFPTLHCLRFNFTWQGEREDLGTILGDWGRGGHIPQLGKARPAASVLMCALHSVLCIDCNTSIWTANRPLQPTSTRYLIFICKTNCFVISLILLSSGMLACEAIYSSRCHTLIGKGQLVIWYPIPICVVGTDNPSSIYSLNCISLYQIKRWINLNLKSTKLWYYDISLDDILDSVQRKYVWPHKPYGWWITTHLVVKITNPKWEVSSLLFTDYLSDHHGSEMVFSLWSVFAKCHRFPNLQMYLILHVM